MPLELLTLLAALAPTETRHQAAGELADSIGAQALFMCLYDSDVGLLLPAPGFRQRLPDAAWWPSFLAQAMGHEYYTADVPTSCSKAHSFRNGDGVLVMMGENINLDGARQLSVLLPLLTTLFQREQLQKITESRVVLWHETAGQAQLLAQSLDLARRDLQEALLRAEGLRHNVDRQFRELELIYQTAPLGLFVRSRSSLSSHQ
ncbi:MAG: hypothetical protein M3Z35_06780 [Nitrospirota bacterium]|nr:hypothetical protein [Nitrospirota bacterium]